MSEQHSAQTHGPTERELDAALAWVTAQAGADDPLGSASNHKYALYAAVEGYLTWRKEAAQKENLFRRGL